MGGVGHSLGHRMGNGWAGGEFLGELHNVFGELVVGYDVIDKSDALGFAGVYYVAGVHELHCPRHSNGHRQELSAAVVRREGALGEDSGESRAFGGDAYVAGERESESGSDGGAVDGGNGRALRRRRNHAPLR